MKPNMRWFFFGISGRISRLPYFLCILFLNLISPALIVQLTPDPDGGIRQDFWGVTFMIYMIVATWILVAATVKRMHDVNVTGWAVLTFFIPVIGVGIAIVVAIVLFFFPGRPGPNAYGEETNRPKT